MSYINRLERNIHQLEKFIEKEHIKIKELQLKFEQHKTTRTNFNIKKRKINEKIRATDSRIRVLRGMHAKEKRHLEEKEEEKRKKNEKKLRAKDEMKMRERKYLDYNKKREHEI
jgi:hypothetical protein